MGDRMVEVAMIATTIPVYVAGKNFSVLNAIRSISPVFAIPVAKIIIRITVHMVSPLQAENASGKVHTWKVTKAIQANSATRGAG